jgi:hypothetical protein
MADIKPFPCLDRRRHAFHGLVFFFTAHTQQRAICSRLLCPLGAILGNLIGSAQVRPFSESNLSDVADPT